MVGVNVHSELQRRARESDPTPERVLPAAIFGKTEPTVARGGIGEGMLLAPAEGGEL